MTSSADASRSADPAQDLLAGARKVAEHASSHLTFKGHLNAAGLEDLRRAYIRATGAGGHGRVADVLAWPLLVRLEEAGPGQEAEALRAGIAGHYRRTHALEEAPFGLLRELAWRIGVNGDWPKASAPADRATASGDLDLALQAFRLDPRGTPLALGPVLEAAGRAAEEADRYLQEARQHLHEEIEEQRQEGPFGFCTGVLAHDLTELLAEAGLHGAACALAQEVLALLQTAEADGFQDRARGFAPSDAPGVAEDIARLRGWLARQGG